MSSHTFSKITGAFSKHGWFLEQVPQYAAGRRIPRRSNLRTMFAVPLSLWCCHVQRYRRRLEAMSAALALVACIACGDRDSPRATQVTSALEVPTAGSASPSDAMADAMLVEAIDAPQVGVLEGVPTPPIVLTTANETVPNAEDTVAKLSKFSTEIAVLTCTGLSYRDSNESPFVVTDYSFSIVTSIRGTAPTSYTAKGGRHTDGRIIQSSHDAKFDSGRDYIVFFVRDGLRPHVAASHPMVSGEEFSIMGKTLSINAITEAEAQ